MFSPKLSHACTDWKSTSRPGSEPYQGISDSNVGSVSTGARGPSLLEFTRQHRPWAAAVLSSLHLNIAMGRPQASFYQAGLREGEGKGERGWCWHRFALWRRSSSGPLPMIFSFQLHGSSQLKSSEVESQNMTWEQLIELPYKPSCFIVSGSTKLNVEYEWNPVSVDKCYITIIILISQRNAVARD